ncbi:MAG TPA: hypothetical protein VGB76_21900, partial [Pyrinomonadaceae bacterium]
ASLDPTLFLPGSLMLFFPLVKSRHTRPLFRTPDEETFFLFDILRTIPHEAVASVLAENRRLYEQSRGLGSRFYTISAVQMEPHDWQEHFRPVWGRLVSEKRRHDPDNVLGAGTRVFN